MIEVSRSLVRSFRSVVKRIANVAGLREPPAVVVFSSERSGLHLRARNNYVAIEYTQAGSFSTEEVEGYLNRNAEILEEAGRYWQEKGQPPVAHDLGEAAAGLRKLAGEQAATSPGAGASNGLSLQDLENHLSALEDKLTASVTRAAPVELLAEIRQEAERGLVRCRQEMNAAQIESVERQFQKKRLYEHYGIPRLSLFYFCP